MKERKRKRTAMYTEQVQMSKHPTFTHYRIVGQSTISSAEAEEGVWDRIRHIEREQGKKLESHNWRHHPRSSEFVQFDINKTIYQVTARLNYFHKDLKEHTNAY